MKMFLFEFTIEHDTAVRKALIHAESKGQAKRLFNQAYTFKEILSISEVDH
jgi:hypothetical protein